MSEITVAFEHPSLGVIARCDLSEIQKEVYQQGRANGYSQAENDYHIQTEKDRQGSYDCGYKQGRADAIEELEKKLKIWDNKVNAIPNYVWKCIKEVKEQK